MTGGAGDNGNGHGVSAGSERSALGRKSGHRGGRPNYRLAEIARGHEGEGWSGAAAGVMVVVVMMAVDAAAAVSCDGGV